MPLKPPPSLRLSAALTLAALPILVSTILVAFQARAVPMFDDYHALLFFLLQYRTLPTPQARLLYLIAAQHNEYKLIFEHLVLLLQYSLTSKVSFGFLILAGNLFVFALLALYARALFPQQPDPTRRITLFLPVCYLLFQLNYVQNLDWAMLALQTLPAVFFTLFSLYLLPLGRPRSFAPACLFALLACLSSANAFLLAPLGAAILWSRRSAQQLLGWTLTFALALALYLYGYQRLIWPGYQPVSIPQRLLFFLSFVGAAAENQHHFPIRNLSVVLGAAILAVFVYAARRRFDRTHPFSFYAAAWCLLSAAAVAQLRSGLGMDLSLTMRYKIYSDLLLIFCYHFVATQLDTPRIPQRTRHLLYAAALAAAVLLFASSDFFGYKFLRNRRQSVARGLNDYAADPQHHAPMVGTDGLPLVGTDGKPISSPEPEFTRQVLTQSIRQGIYTLPPPAQR